MALKEEEKAYIIEEAVRLLKSQNREGLIAALRERLQGSFFEDDPAAERRDLDEVVLAVTEAVCEMIASETSPPPEGSGEE
jgi:hypothetical protein